MNNKLQQTFCIALTLGLLSFFSFSFAPVFAQNPTAKNVFGDRLLKNYTRVEGDEEWTDNYDFYYNDKGQLMEIKEEDDDGTECIAFDYSSGSIDGYDYDIILIDTFGEVVYKCYLKIGSNNFIESCYELYKNGSSEVVKPRKTLGFMYNVDNQLEKIDFTFLNNGEERATIFTYDNGNIVYTHGYWYDTTVSYSSSIVNDDNIMLWNKCFGCDSEPAYLPWMYYAGLLGKSTRLLPSSEQGSIFSNYFSFTWHKSADNLQSIMNEVDEPKHNVSCTHTFTWSSASTGISTVEKSEEQTASKVYGLDGRLRTSPQKGFNIIETDNGKFEKVMK